MIKVKDFLGKAWCVSCAIGRCVVFPLFLGLWRSACGAFIFASAGFALYGFDLASAADQIDQIICIDLGSSALLMLTLLLMHGIGCSRKEDR